MDAARQGFCGKCMKDVLAKMPQLPQRQDGTSDQLADLVQVANRLGMYDAADYLKQVTRGA